VLRAYGVDKVGGLSTVDNLEERVVEESVLDIKLASLPFKGERQ
jgi:hypothetical protein